MVKEKRGCYKGVSNKEVTNISATTILFKFVLKKEVSISNVTNTNLNDIKNKKIGSCCTQVTNLNKLTSILKNKDKIKILYSLTKLNYVYLNILHKVTYIQTYVLLRYLQSLETDQIIQKCSRNKDNSIYTSALFRLKTISNYHLDKIQFYQFNKNYQQLFSELMVVWEEELPKDFVSRVVNYQNSIRKTKREVNKEREFKKKTKDQQIIKEKEDKRLHDLDNEAGKIRTKLFNKIINSKMIGSDKRIKFVEAQTKSIKDQELRRMIIEKFEKSAYNDMMDDAIKQK